MNRTFEEKDFAQIIKAADNAMLGLLKVIEQGTDESMERCDVALIAWHKIRHQYVIGIAGEAAIKNS